MLFQFGKLWSSCLRPIVLLERSPISCSLEKGFSTSALLMFGGRQVFAVSVRPVHLGHFAAPLASSHQMQYHHLPSSCDNQKCLQTSPDAFWGWEWPLLRTPDLVEYEVESRRWWEEVERWEWNGTQRATSHANPVICFYWNCFGCYCSNVPLFSLVNPNVF